MEGVKSRNGIMRIVNFVIGLLLVYSSILLGQTPQKGTAEFEKPNIILINMDDMGLGDVDPYGATGYK